MRIQTFSIVVGTRACNASCTFCVSKMTGFGDLPKSRRINRRNFAKAARLAQMAGTTTVLLTGKGEPTLYPEQITSYLELLVRWNFPLIELQTNALEIGRLARDGVSRIKGFTAETLLRWHDLGLNTIAISIVDVRLEPNQATYHEDYPDLATTIAFLHTLGFSVRLCVMMHHPYVDSTARLEEVIAFSKQHRVEHLTVRGIRKPEQAHDDEASAYVRERGLTDDEIGAIRAWLEERGTRLMTIRHGAAIYDVDGQNVCISDCLTLDASGDDIRTLIFFDNGRVSYDWQFPGAVFIGGEDMDAADAARPLVTLKT